MEETAKKFDAKYYVHSVIGLILMFGIPLIPPIEPITHIGMQIGGIFIGLVYLCRPLGCSGQASLALWHSHLPITPI